MKREYLFITITLFLFLITGCGAKSKKIDNSKIDTAIATIENKEEKAVQTLKSFYTMYITECSKQDENSDVITSLKSKYLTKKLQEKLKDIDLDYDPIIDAQDCDESLIKTLEIQSKTGQKNIYDVCYSYNNERKCITLLLVYDSGNYLIDDILSDINIHKPK